MAARHVDGILIANPSGGAPIDSKIATGVDDCARFAVMATVMPWATGRRVCLAFAAALRECGIPEEVLTDNGKQFTARFGLGGEVLFDRICRDNGITHRLTAPPSDYHRQGGTPSRDPAPGTARRRWHIRQSQGCPGRGGRPSRSPAAR